MNVPGGDTTELRRLLLGSNDRWDDGELAVVLISGLRLSTIESTIGLVRLPWPEEVPNEPPASRARRGLSSMIDDADDPNLKALKALTDTRKPTSTRLEEVAALFGRTTSRTGRNRLKHEILPWFFDYLIEHLEHASTRLKASDPKAEPVVLWSTTVKPLPDSGNYQPEFRSPVDPAQLADALTRRHIQVALDLGDLDAATHLAQVAAAHGADLVEVGDPLIKRFGMEAVRRVKAAIPGMPIVVEFSSSDWVDEQIEIAVEAGADLVYVLGLDQPSRIERAVRTARSRRVGIVPAIPAHVNIRDWCSTVENAGADAISIIRNIDSAGTAAATTARMREIAEVAKIPLVISGGFTPHNVTDVLDDAWSILIVGGAFVHAREPANVLEALRQTLEPAA